MSKKQRKELRIDGRTFSDLSEAERKGTVETANRMLEILSNAAPGGMTNREIVDRLYPEMPDEDREQLAIDLDLDSEEERD